MQETNITGKISINELTAFFKALSDPTRLRIVDFLQSVQNPRCVGAISRHIQVSQSATSQHLRILRQINLVIGERRGYHIHYEINHQQMEIFLNQFQYFMKR
jgi:ArsR family transcriptional regulator, arsenate/arsenite/antimonite-responsive transcriptional repressor